MGKFLKEKDDLADIITSVDLSNLSAEMKEAFAVIFDDMCSYCRLKNKI